MRDRVLVFLYNNGRNITDGMAVVGMALVYLFLR